MMNVGLPLMKNVLTPLGKSVLIPLGLATVSLAADTGIHQKILSMRRHSDLA